MNNINLTGRICKSIDFSSGKKERANFVLADNTFGDAQFIHCVSFDEKVVQKLKNFDSGYLLHVIGRLELKKYQEKYYTSVIVDKVSLLSKTNKNTESEEIGIPENTEEIPF